jgi:hypothetical protein
VVRFRDARGRAVDPKRDLDDLISLAREARNTSAELCSEARELVELARMVVEETQLTRQSFLL